jgi:DNA-binding NarL/FixJ family response regulator
VALTASSGQVTTDETEDVAARVALVASLPLLREGLGMLLEDVSRVAVTASVACLDALSPEALKASSVVLMLVDDPAVVRTGRFVAVRRALTGRLVGLHDNLPGADVDLLRSSGFDTMLDVGAGEAAIIDVVLGVRSRSLRRWEPPRIGVARLTDRERAVLSRVAGGSNSREIAAQLSISPHTVENYKQRVFRKLGVANQAQAVATALRHGLLGPVADGGR